MTRFKIIIAAILSSVILWMAVAPAIASPVTDPEASAKSQICGGIGETGGDCSDTSGFSSLVKLVVNLLSYLVGIAAVIMVIVAGFRYITSGGESSKVSGAKSAILYAIVGLVIVASAQFIVHFAFGEATSGQCASNPTLAAGDSQCK